MSLFLTEESFETPLGNLQVDRPVVQKLLQSPYFSEASTVFDNEHSLEMQLPWIRKTLGKVKLVPMAVGIVGPQEINSIASAIKNELSEGDLIIVSSDFTHYGPRFNYQPFIDEKTNSGLQAKIKELDLQAFNCLKAVNAELLLDFYARTGDTICGIYPAAILLAILPSKTEVELAKYSSSQDSAINPDGNSVSYMSIFCSHYQVAISSEQNPTKSGRKPTY